MQQRVIELDYTMEADVAEINAQRSLLYYILKQLGLGAEPAACRPQDLHIVLVSMGQKFAARERSVL